MNLNFGVGTEKDYCGYGGNTSDPCLLPDLFVHRSYKNLHKVVGICVNPLNLHKCSYPGLNPECLNLHVTYVNVVFKSCNLH